MTDSVFSGCWAERGGAVYVDSGTANIARSFVCDCSASEYGGGIFSASGRTTLSDGTLVSGCRASEGCSLFLLAGEVSYALPAPAGRWLPNALCQVYRDACAYHPIREQEKQTACLTHREDCALTLDPAPSEWFCQAPTFVQPCNWNNATGDPLLLGQLLYQLPLLPVEQDFPFACAAGLLGSMAPDTQSTSACGGLCPAGTSSKEGSGSCGECKAGTYASNPGQGECIPCPHPLSSQSGSTTCSFCKAAYYLKNSTEDPSDIFAYPTEHCMPCPPNAECPRNTTLETLGVPRGYWRASLTTAELRKCESDTCAGSAVAVSDLGNVQAASTGVTDIPGLFCEAGHTGPLCESCVAESDYFDRVAGHCVSCPPPARLAITAVLVVTLLAVLAGTYTTIRYNPRSRRFWRQMTTFESEVGLQPKFKIIVSFYQVRPITRGTTGRLDLRPLPL